MIASPSLVPPSSSAPRVVPCAEASHPNASSARAEQHSTPQRVINLPRYTPSGSPAPASLQKARLAAELLALPLTSTGLTLQQHLCAWLRHGVQPGHDEHQLHEALRWLHAPFGDAVAAAYGSASRALVPYVLDQLLLGLFPTLQDAQRQQLTADIRMHAQDLPLATWTRALALPRDGQGGEIRLRALHDAEHWAALRTELIAAPVPDSGLAQVGLATAALGTAAVVSTLMPAVAVPALLAGSAGFLGITAQAAVSDATAPQAREVQSDVLRQRADAVLQTLLPAWDGTQRDALYAIWAERPNDRSLLTVSLQATQALQDADGCIDRALGVVKTASRLPPAVPPAGDRAAVAEALARLLAGLSPPQSTVAAGTAPTDSQPLRGVFPAGRAEPVRPASVGLFELAQHTARMNYRAIVERQIDQVGADPEDTRTTYQRRCAKAGLRLLHARSIAPGPGRLDAIATARARVDNLRNPAPLIARARAGKVQQAMALNRVAAAHTAATAGSPEQAIAPGLPRAARTGALTEPGSLALAPSDVAGPFSGIAALSMPLRAHAAAPVAGGTGGPQALAPAASPVADAPVPATPQARLRLLLGLMPEIAGDGQESAIADYLDLQAATGGGQSTTVRAELARAWGDHLQDQAEAGRARKTLSAAAADLVTQLVEQDRQGTPAGAHAVGRFDLRLLVDGSGEVAVPGAVVITGKATDTSPRSASGPIVVMLPGIGLLEYAPGALDTLLRDMDAHPVLRAALYGLIPLGRLQPAPGGRGQVTLGVTPMDADRTGEEVIERVLQGGIDIRRAGAQRAQPVRPLADLVGPYVAAAGVVEHALAQLADHGLLQAPVQDAGRALGLTTAWIDYLDALVDAPTVPGLQSPQDYATGEQLQRHIGERLQAHLQSIGIDAAPDEIRVRWQQVHYRPEPVGLPHNPAGARLLPPIQHDLSLAELATRNIGFVDIPFGAGAQAFDRHGKALPSLTPALMREWIRGLDLDGSYRGHLQQQFDSSQRGGPGDLRLRAFRHTFPARIALEEQLAFAHQRLQGPSVLRQMLAHPGSRAVEHRGRVQQVQVGPLTLITHAVIDDTYVFDRNSVLPGTLAVRTGDGRVEAYVAGLHPSPFLSADNEAELNALLAGHAMQDWLKAHLPAARHRQDMEEPGTWSELSVTPDQGDVLDACYRRWVGHLQRQADDLVVSDQEQRGKDILDVLGGVYEFAENLLPLRLEALSMAARTLAPLLSRSGVSAQAGRLAAETALLQLFSRAGTGTTLGAAPRRPLLAAGVPRSLRQQASLAHPRYIQTRQGDYRIPEGSRTAASGLAVLLDPVTGQPAGGVARYDRKTLQWRIEPAQPSRSADYSHLEEHLDDHRLRRLSTQGNGVYDLDGAQFVRIDGGWFRTEVRSELGGGRYLMAPGGRVRSDLLLARVDGVWKVTQRPRGGLRGGAPGTQDTSDLAVLKHAVPAPRLLDDTAIHRALSVHGPLGGQVGASLRRDLRDSAQQAMVGRIGAGKASFEAPGFGPAGRMAMLCALASDPLLGQGRRIELYTGSAATGQRRIVIGRGAEPLFRLQLSSELPTLEQVIVLLNPDVVAAALKLPAGTAPAALVDPVTAHLQRTVKRHRDDVQASLRTLADDIDAAQPAVAALQLQFGLDRGLAEEVLQRQPELTGAVLRYQRPQQLVDAIADALARQGERTLRQALLDGRVPSVDALTLLQDVLAALLPSWKIVSDLHPEGRPQLHMALQPNARRTHTLVFGADGVRVSGHAQPYAKWQQAVSAVLGTESAIALRNANGLGSAVAERLRALEMAAPTARIQQHRHAVLQTAGRPACPTAAGSCPASARRPDQNDLERQLNLRDTAVSLRRDAAKALDDALGQARAAASAWLAKDTSGTAARSWRGNNPPGSHAGDDARLRDFIKAHWKSSAAAPRELSAFVQAFAAREALGTANILVADVSLRIDGRPLAWDKPAFVSSSQLGGRYGFSKVEGVTVQKVMVPARRRPGHEGVATPGQADFEAPQALLHRVMTEDHPFGRYVVEPRAQLPGSAPQGVPDTQLHWIGSEADLQHLLRTHVNIGGTQLHVGDPVYLSSVRRCTESQFLNEVADAVEAELPGVWQRPEMLDRVTGSVGLFSDRVPCLNNCQLLMQAAAETLPGVDIKMSYGDPPGHGGVIRPHRNPPRLFPLP
jgi:hypothetical protein